MNPNALDENEIKILLDAGETGPNKSDPSRINYSNLALKTFLIEAKVLVDRNGFVTDRFIFSTENISWVMYELGERIPIP